MKSLGTRVSLPAILLGASVAFLAAVTSAAPAPDVSSEIEMLGNPYSTLYKDGTPRVYARNIWDLQAYNGKIYIGGGNSSNTGPAQNAGPAPIYTYDPKTGKFETNFTVADEQVDVFYVFSDGLYTPGHDPKESWDLGNFYRMDKDGKWTKIRTIPKGIHTYAMSEFNKCLFAGIGTRGPSVCVSKDAGATWKTCNVNTGGRVHSFLTFPDQLYAIGILVPKWGSAFQYDSKSDDFIERKDIDVNIVFPKANASRPGSMKAIRPIQMGSKVLYIGALCHNDHQSIPFGVYVATANDNTIQARAVSIPDSARPWDIIINANTAYLLLEDEKDKETIVRVWSSKDLETWTELFNFKYPTFARSFEILNGDFYFGMGCEIKNAMKDKWNQSELKPETGNIIRIKGKVPKDSATAKTPAKEPAKGTKTPAKP